MVSGLARGIDGRAHQGALNGSRGGAQVAVLPCALDAIHPRMHEGLAEAIVARGGLLLTEQAPGVQVERWMFASRNRILTGLALNNTRPTTWNRLRKTCKGWTMDLERQVFTLEMLGCIRRLPGRAFLRN